MTSSIIIIIIIIIIIKIGYVAYFVSLCNLTRRSMRLFVVILVFVYVCLRKYLCVLGNGCYTTVVSTNQHLHADLINNTYTLINIRQGIYMNKKGIRHTVSWWDVDKSNIYFWSFPNECKVGGWNEAHISYHTTLFIWLLNDICWFRN